MHLQEQVSMHPPQGLGLARPAAALLLASAALLLLGLCVGSQGFEPLWWDASPEAQNILWQIRWPRSAGAWLAGALLGLAGAVAQGLFRNPLADPYLLGSASGASLGLVLALLLVSLAAQGLAGWDLAWLQGRWGQTAAAFAGAWLAVMCTWVLARGVQHGLRLLLAGMVVGVFLGAWASLVTWLRPDLLLNAQAFMLGTVAWLDNEACALMAAALLLCAAWAWRLSRVLDALVLGEDTALSLGLPLQTARRSLVLVLALATASAVAQTGLIAFVGLAAPHMVRSRLACTHAGLLLLSPLCGGLLLLGADLAARWVLAPQELPVGVLTAALGGAYLLWLMRKAP
jgi:iron complex transport system permease protein